MASLINSRRDSLHGDANRVMHAYETASRNPFDFARLQPLNGMRDGMFQLNRLSFEEGGERISYDYQLDKKIAK